MGKYDDIINTDWPLPSDREKMPLKQRAKIFLPFAALKGYEEALEKTRQQNMEEYATKFVKDEDFFED